MEPLALNQEREIDELIYRLDLSLVEPDPDYDLDESESVRSPKVLDEETNVVSIIKDSPLPTATVNPISQQPTTNSKQLTNEDTNKGHQTLATPQQQNPQSQNRQNHQLPQQQQQQPAQQRPAGTDDEKKSGRFDIFRKLRGSSTDSSAESRKSKRRKTLEQLKVDSLPQSFVAKYVGCKACRGLWGIQHTREPVDALVDDLRHLDRATGDRRDDLPLVSVDVTEAGIAIAVHPRNRSRRPVSDVGLLPLEFISYAVQDTRYSRIFAFVLVRELSSRARATECHAFLCDTPATARTLALSVALAFRTYEQKLAGKPFRFVVDLRWPDELESELAEQRTSGSRTNFQRAEFEA